jgi:hypothetical protein
VLTKFIQEKGLALEANLKLALARDTRDDSDNAQTLWKEFKDGIVAKARERAKIVMPKQDKDIKEVELQLKIILADRSLTDEDRKLSGAVLTEKLATLHRKWFRESKLSAQIRNRLEGEIISKC